MKTAAIATNTFREGVRQPVFYVLVVGGSALVLASTYFTLFSFGEEAKIVKDMGLATITLLGLLIALFTSSSVIADEIDRKTVLTVLCKPVTRVQFVLGKFLGIVSTSFAAMAVLTLVLIAALFLHEQAGSGHAHSSLQHSPSILVGALFAAFQVFVLAAVSVAISTRLPMIVNLTACLSLYLLGHLGRYLFESTERGGLAGYISTVVYALVPNLANFNVAEAIGLGRAVPLSYVALSALYAALYASIALLIALASFETREVM